MLNPKMIILVQNYFNHGSVALMACVLEACDLDTYADAHG
jgi:hypothetical protein